MTKKDWMMLLFIISILLILYFLYNAIKANIQKQSPDSETSVIVPFQTSLKPNCKDVRTSCDPANPNDCSNKCNDFQKMVCTNIGDLQPSSGNTNGGGYVCLPEVPTISCDTSKGGAQIWMGYGMTNQQSWDCVCTQPQIYNGPGCSYQNPSYCSGGNITGPNMDCVCPANTVKMWRAGVNTPFCASTDPSSGGINGLVGNYLSPPNWGNVLFNLNKTDSYAEWANRIALEMNLADNNAIITKIKDIIMSVSTSSGPTTPVSLVRMNDTIISAICSDPTITNARNGVEWATKMCSSNSAGRPDAYKNANSVATYTYYDKSYPDLK